MSIGPQIFARAAFQVLGGHEAATDAKRSPSCRRSDMRARHRGWRRGRSDALRRAPGSHAARRGPSERVFQLRAPMAPGSSASGPSSARDWPASARGRALPRSPGRLDARKQAFESMHRGRHRVSLAARDGHRGHGRSRAGRGARRVQRGLAQLPVAIVGAAARAERSNGAGPGRLSDGAEMLVPADISLRRLEGRPGFIPPFLLGNGMAAGREPRGSGAARAAGGHRAGMPSASVGAAAGAPG